MKKSQAMRSAIIVAAIIVSCLGVVFGVHRWRQNHAFDPQRWKDAPAARSKYRVKAVDDLLSRHQLRGMARSEIVELLGQPGRSQKGSFEPRAMVYWLGSKSDNFFIDHYWLVIRFDAQDNVNKVVITTD